MHKNIESHRRVTTTLIISGPEGAPLAGQEVRIAQTGHEFLFGTAAFDLVPFTNGQYEGLESDRAAQRVRKLEILFNAATLPFYCARFESRRGSPTTEQLKNAARWCLEHGLSAKGPPLCWHNPTPDWLISIDNGAILDGQAARVRREVPDFRGLIDT